MWEKKKYPNFTIMIIWKILFQICQIFHIKTKLKKMSLFKIRHTIKSILPKLSNYYYYYKGTLCREKRTIKNNRIDKI